MLNGKYSFMNVNRIKNKILAKSLRQDTVSFYLNVAT